VSSHYGDKVLKMRTIYKILEQIQPEKNTDDRRKYSVKEILRIAVVTFGAEADFQICCKRFPFLSPWHICWNHFSFLHKDNWPVKKSARDDLSLVAGEG
jgi:hypothetical protein